MSVKLKIFFILCLISFSALVSGCQEIEDIDRRRIITSLGIDAAPENLMKVTIKSPLISESAAASEKLASQSNQTNIFISVTARGVLAALVEMQNKDEHSLFIGQCKTVAIGEALARRGIKPVLDFLERYPTLPPTAMIFIAQPSVEQVFAINWKEFAIHDMNILDFFTKRQKLVYIPRIWTVVENIYDPLKDPFIPIAEPSPDRTTAVLRGLAVMHDDRMVGELNPEESVLLGFVGNFFKSNPLVIPSTGLTDITYQSVKGATKITVSYDKDHPNFKLALKMRAVLGEQGKFQTDISPRQLRKIEESAQEYLTARVIALLEKLRDLGSDPLQLGDYFRIQQAKHFSFKAWPDSYRKARFSVTVNFRIEGIGILK